MSIVSMLYRLARGANTARAIMQPRRAPTRGKNLLLGRALARGGIWKRLWGKW